MHSVEKVTFRAILIFILTSCFYLYEFTLQVTPGTISQTLMHDFAINATILGSVSSCFYISYTIGQIPGGILLDQFGGRFVLPIAVLICAIGAFLFGIAKSAEMLSLARFLIGLGASVSFVGILYVSATWFPAKYFALLVGIAEMMGTLGAMVGDVPLSLLFKANGWRSVIFFIAIIGVILAILDFIIIRNSPYLIKKSILKKSAIRNIKIVLKNPRSWGIGVYSFLIWAPMLAFCSLWAAPFLHAKNPHISTNVVFLAISSSWLGASISSPLIGWISDKLHKRSAIMSTTAFIGFCSVSCIIFLSNLPVEVLYILMFFTGVASSGQTISFASIKDHTDNSVISTANGLNNMVIVCGGILFQPVIGKILDASWHGVISNGIRIYSLQSYKMALLLVPSCYLLAFLCSLFFIKDLKIKK